ncbi:ribosome maturation factor RimM [Campylobacter mucosalis]|uniref:ribosome maturation factor RimM n=1 Tax=Campylobacter mucosalis TaxID=202 RepID=UPI00146FD34F|nr:ribosome maturation factor RimM [Campylobacter mucosalis]
MNSEFIQVATLGKSVGLKGYLKLHNKSDFIEQFKKDSKFFDEKGAEFVIKHFDKTNSTALFYGFENVDLAKNLTNKTLYTTKELTRKSCKLKKNEYFYFDIIGLNVVENDEILGVVTDIDDTTSNHLLEVKTAKNLVDLKLAKHFFIPYVDNFIISVDLDLKQISVKNSKAILENS